MQWTLVAARWCGASLAVAGLVAAAQNVAPMDHASRGVALQQAGQAAAAMREYRAALAADPAQPGVLTNLAVLEVQQGTYNDAIRDYQQALRLDPHLDAALLNLGLAYYKTGELPAAAERFQAYRDRHPRELRAGLLLADTLLQLGKNREAVAAAAPLEQMAPNDLGVAYVLGTAYIRNGESAKGEPLINRILSHGDAPQAHMMLGDAYFLGHDFAHAREQFESALKADPQLPLAEQRLAQIELVLGDSQAAFRHFERAYAANPHNFEVNFYLGYLYRQRGDNAQARRYLERAVAMRPDTFQPNFQLALLALDAGNISEARQRAETATRLFPDELEGHVILGKIYYRLHLRAEGAQEQVTVRRLTLTQQAKSIAHRQSQSDTLTPLPPAPAGKQAP